MKRLKHASKLGLILSAVLIVAGGFAIVSPEPMRVAHANACVKQIPRTIETRHCVRSVEYVGEKRFRIYGALMVALGIGMVWFSVWTPRE